MARVWCAILRWSSRGPRLRTVGFLVLTFLIILTTSLNLVNLNDVDINWQIKNSEYQKRIARNYDISAEKTTDDNNEENILLNNINHLKDEVNKTRSRIFTHKQSLEESMQYRNDLEQNLSGNKLKRHLMNVDGKEKSAVTIITNTAEEHRQQKRQNFTFLYHNLFSKQRFLSCQDMPSNLDVLETLGSGYTKKVTKANIRGKYVALKRANRKGHDGTECAQYGMGEQDCYRLANYKVLKELALLQQLKSPNIIQLLGYCLKDETKEDKTLTVTIATEFGEPLKFITLLQMSWEDRLRIAFGITNLLLYLHNSPVGALTIHDFKLEQFVLVNNELKLADLDDIDDSLVTCKESTECGIGDMRRAPCVNGRCQSYSDRLNVYHTHKLFYSLLPFEAPYSVQGLVTELTNNTGQSSWGSERISNQLHQILNMYQKSTIHLNYGKTDLGADSDIPFERFSNQDFPGIHDYWCHGTIYAGANSCAFSVKDENEAKYICNRDPQCKAFVMTSQKTWTGRTVIFLKSETTEPVASLGNTLFIRRVT